jgi:tetratricopeptide (TPR) repeat protein
MKSKKGGKSKGKKGGGGKKKGKKSPQQPPRADEKPGFKLAKEDRATVAGFGCMVTRSWAEAYAKRRYPLMIEIARTNMQQYGDKVTDVQSKASLLHILGYSLTKVFGKNGAAREGAEYEMEAMELIQSLDDRSEYDIMFGVWPESRALDWIPRLKQLNALELNQELERIHEMINLTRRTINSDLESKRNNYLLEMLFFLSEGHYKIELNAIYGLSEWFSLLSEEDLERWVAIFGKRVEEIESIYEGEGWDLKLVRDVKACLMKGLCSLYERQGKVELALEILDEALKEDVGLNNLHAELCLKTGRIEEAFKSMEELFSILRSLGAKSEVSKRFEPLLDLVPVESRSLFEEFIWQYPHVLWAASSVGFYELSEEESKALRSQLEAKKKLYCVNCNKELAKIYRCSRCEIATYCGTACQKEAWKEHKKICKKRE